MRWFTDEAYEHDEAEWDAMLARYDAHIREIADRLPPELATLAKEPRLNLHDARIRSIVVDRQAGTVEMNLTTEPDHSQGFRDVDLHLVFGGATFVPDDLQPVAYAVGATYSSEHWGTTRTEVLAQEVDIADDGRFLLRIRLWPFHEFAIAFATMSLTESPASPDDGRAGSFTFTDEEEP